MARPQLGDYFVAYQQRYIDAATGETVAEIIDKHTHFINRFICTLPDEKANYSYAEGKWTVKQVLQHMIDTERILGYRALCVSRKETIALPGFDEDSYAANAPATHRTLDDLKGEFVMLRASTDMLLLSFTEEQLLCRGIASNNPTTVNSLCFVIIGHALHHIKVLKERYL